MLEQSAAKIASLTNKIASLTQYGNRSHSALECLREISALLPQGVDLSSFSYKKGASLSLRGECGTPVKTEGVRSKTGPSGVQKSEFS